MLWNAGSPDFDHPVTGTDFITYQANDTYFNEVELLVSGLVYFYFYDRNVIPVWESNVDGAVQEVVAAACSACIL